MARKSKSSYRGKERMNKIEPSSMSLFIQSTPVSPGSNITNFVDLSQIASLVNRRFYRQGINWAVAGFKCITTAGYAGSITVSQLPNTWVMANSWEKSMRAWMKMNTEALAETESVRPRFLDFKIYADADHFALGYVNNLLPTSNSIPQSPTPTYLAGEWEPSKIVVPFGPSSPANTTDFSLMAVGANYNGGVDPVVSLIEGYAASRGLPNVLDPNAPDDADDASGSIPENWMAAIFNEGTDQTSEVLEDMIAENNIAPYPFENDGVNLDTMYPGGANQGSGLALHDVSNVTGTTVGGITRLKGGNFPCGLIRFDFANTGTPGAIVGIIIDLIPGSHRGYLCEPMTEM